MKLSLAHTLRHYDKKNIGKDILAGLIIMAVSIPISMGYALIAGLPAVYGLYGSVFPILVFALLSTSPQFIFGVDAAPAALIGSALLTLHVEAGSEEAMAVVPVLTFFVAMWLLAFSFMKAGKLVNYISAPVMGGFITGICSTIILMQVPKILGGTAGTGEFFELAKHIGQTAKHVNMPSILLGVASLVILLVAGLSMIVLLLCGTGFIQYLPVPVLTAIVISALLGATEFDLMARLWKVSRTECMIFVGAFLGVLLLGTINGVLIGILLSFAEVIIRTAKPSTCFLGIQPGHKHFRDLKESSQIHALSGVLVYRFSSNLFFANVQVLKNDIEDHIKPDTKAVILDAGGIGSLDITAADCLKRLHQSLKEKGIRFYMTEHISDVNEQLRKLGLGYLIEEGCVRRTIHIALKDMGINRPYPLEDGVDNEDRSASRKRADNRVQEFVWAFGSDAEKQIERQIEKQIAQLKGSGDIENLLHGRWAHMEELDEDEWLEHLEEHLKEIVNISGKDEHTLAMQIEEHRKQVHDRIAKNHPELAERFRERRHVLDAHLKERHPKVYELVLQSREKNERNR